MLTRKDITEISLCSDSDYSGLILLWRARYVAFYLILKLTAKIKRYNMQASGAWKQQKILHTVQFTRFLFTKRVA